MNEHQMALYTQRQIAGLEAERAAHLTQIAALVEERNELKAQIEDLKAVIRELETQR